MKFFKIIFFIFLAAILAGIAISKLTVRDLVAVDFAEKECAMINQWLLYDHLFERAAMTLGKSSIIKNQDGFLKIRAYSIFRIPIGESFATCNEATQKAGREVKTFEHWRCLQTWPLELCSMFVAEEREKLYEACAIAKIPETADDSSLYYDQKLAVVRWWDADIQDNVALYLPYEPENYFEGCSESAKEFLRHVPNGPNRN